MLNKPYRPVHELNVTMLINDISKLFHDRMRRESERIGIQSGYRQLLFHLAREDGKTQLDLVKLTYLKAPTVSVSLQNMERAGIVVRKTDSDDLRQTRVFLTDKGKELDLLMREKIARTDEIITKGITEEEQAIVKQVLAKMRNNILDESE